jgi:hypothetical protein
MRGRHLSMPARLFDRCLETGVVASAYYFFGTLWPLAAKALPNAVRGPPPAGLT